MNPDQPTDLKPIDPAVTDAIKNWLSQVVIGLNLCPFAKRELADNRVRFVASPATTEEALLLDLQGELVRLEADAQVETTLLIHPQVLTDFSDYNQFLDLADAMLEDLGFEGVFQIASFHPDYQFGGTEPGDAENYTNRSPYPLLHILREDSLEQAIDRYPDVGQIPARNIERMEQMGADTLQTLFKACFHGAKGSSE